MAKKPEAKKVPADLMGPLQGHLKMIGQNYGDDALKWYKSFLAASVTAIVLGILYLMGSMLNWAVVFIIAGVAVLSLLFKVIFWSDGSW